MTGFMASWEITSAQSPIYFHANCQLRPTRPEKETGSRRYAQHDSCESAWLPLGEPISFYLFSGALRRAGSGAATPLAWGVRSAGIPGSGRGLDLSLMRARESGVTLDCHPLSVWYLAMAAWLRASHTPVASPVRYFSRMSAVWISRARSAWMPCCPCFFHEVLRLPFCDGWPVW